MNLYQLNHKHQTVFYVKDQLKKQCTLFNKATLSVWETIKLLDSVKDESDPDLDLPQIVHAFQTAENLRKRYPDKDWLHLVGLIHDLGKVLILPEFGGLSQWSVVGDTFPVGCKFSDEILYYSFFEDNVDYYNKNYNTKYGIYSPHCGLDNVLFSFGHDEYLYQVLKHNRCKIPEIGLKIIRYHSFYAWHKNNAYEYLMSEEDYLTKQWCQIFSTADLYSKESEPQDIEKLKNYYQKLINKYFIGKINF